MISLCSGAVVPVARDGIIRYNSSTGGWEVAGGLLYWLDVCDYVGDYVDNCVYTYCYVQAERSK